MHVVIAGGTGFLGRPLTRQLLADGHLVSILTRALPSASVRRDLIPGVGEVQKIGWQPNGALGEWATHMDGTGAVINLAGESIGAGRWSLARKARLRDSRIQATRSLVAALAVLEPPPAVFISASAVGYYGSRGDELLRESAAPGDDYLSTLCADWEAEAGCAESDSTRVCLVRSGLVLDRNGGALARMTLPFKLGVGGAIGPGTQYVSWVHRHDWVALIGWILDHDQVTGPLNATTPNPVTNAEFANALGRALGRPSWLRTPSFVVRLALGEMADALLLTGQRVVPHRPLEMGFAFTYPELDQAFDAIF